MFTGEDKWDVVNVASIRAKLTIGDSDEMDRKYIIESNKEGTFSEFMTKLMNIITQFVPSDVQKENEEVKRRMSRINNHVHRDCTDFRRTKDTTSQLTKLTIDDVLLTPSDSEFDLWISLSLEVEFRQ